MISHYGAHDAAQPWGADDPAQVLAALRELRTDDTQLVLAVDADLTGPTVPDELVDAAVAGLGALDILVCDHARSGVGRRPRRAGRCDDRRPLRRQHALVAAAGAGVRTGARRRPSRRQGGVHDVGAGPRPDARARWPTPRRRLRWPASRRRSPPSWRRAGITVNTVNPGPVNTGYLDGAAGEALLPASRWGASASPTTRPG